MRLLRWAAPFLILVGLLAGVARAQGGTVTLPDGGVATVEVSGNKVTVTLPNGIVGVREQVGSGASWAVSVEASAEDMQNLDIAYGRWNRDNPQPPKRSGANVLPGLLLLVFGGLSAAFPHAAWYLRDGWKFKDAEPSEAALALTRVGGGLAAVVGLVLLFV